MFNADLNNNEKRIAIFLNKVGTIRMDQVKLINGTPESLTERNIYRLKAAGEVFIRTDKSKKHEYLVAHPFDFPHPDMVDALWVILGQIKDININEIFIPDKPCTLGFVKRKKVYEIATTSGRNIKDLARTIDENFKKNPDYDPAMSKERICVIFTVGNKSDIKEIPSDISYDCAVAVLTKLDENGKLLDTPKVSYYKTHKKKQKE